MKPNLSSIDSMRSVADQVYPLSLKRISLVDLLRRNGISTNEPQSLHTILDRWDPTRGATVFRLLWQNTFLLQVKAEVEILTPVGYVKKDVTFCEKPDTPARATEFGAMLASSDFDAAFLCEVWTDEVKLLLLVALMGNLQSIAEGPPPEKSTIAVAGLAGAPLIRPAGAGLCTLGIRQVIVDHTYHVFSVQGELPRDSDALAKKAVLLSRVAIGSGVLDCYTTHLFNGNDLVGEGPSSQERLEIQRTQINEVVEFMKDTHNPANVALVMGDFNINARDPAPVLDGLAPYQVLTHALNAVNMFDVWPFQFPHDGSVAVGQGITDVGSDDPSLVGRCAATGLPEAGVCSENESAFPSTPPPSPGRIDYMFLEQPTASHTLNVVASAVQRKVFTRDGAFPFLSDHLGLTCNLICSPRSQG